MRKKEIDQFTKGAFYLLEWNDKFYDFTGPWIVTWYLLKEDGSKILKEDWFDIELE